MEQSIKETDNLGNTKQIDSCPHEQQEPKEEELLSLLLPNVCDLPLTPPSAIQSNFVSYFAPGSSSSHTYCRLIQINRKYTIATKFIVKTLNLAFTPFLPIFMFFFFFPDLMKPGHDQYVYRHANGYNYRSFSSEIFLFIVNV